MAVSVFVLGLVFVLTSQSASNLFAQDVPKASIEKQLSLLSDPNYSTRQMAFWRLVRLGDSVIAPIEEAIPKADADACEQMIRILSELSVDPNIDPGPAALAAMQRLSKSRITLFGTLASRSLEALGQQQRMVVESELIQMGAFAGYGIQVVTSADRTSYHIRIGSDFRGGERDLDRLQWLHGIEVLVLEGSQVTGAWLERAARMPDLKTLQIRRANINGSDLAKLKPLARLEVLELIYVPIDDSAVDDLADLPIWNSLRLFGTHVSTEGNGLLADALPDIEIIYGKGGFLGVSIGRPDEVVLSEVPDNGAAARAGLRAEDRLLAIGDVKLNKFDDLRRELAKYSPGEVIEITYERLNATYGRLEQATVSATLGEQP